VVVETRKEVDDVKELLTIAREYCNALRIEIKRKEEKDDPSRQVRGPGFPCKLGGYPRSCCSACSLRPEISSSSPKT
jgi:hypothetical protein